MSCTNLASPSIRSFSGFDAVLKSCYDFWIALFSPWTTAPNCLNLPMTCFTWSFVTRPNIFEAMTPMKSKINHLLRLLFIFSGMGAYLSSGHKFLSVNESPAEKFAPGDW